MAGSGTGERRRRGRPAVVSREQILGAALELVDREGLAALTTTRLASELGIGVMTLYRYVADKADLVTGIIDLAQREDPPPTPSLPHWRDRSLDGFRRLRAAILRHPSLAEVGVQRAAIRPQNLHGLEALLACLVAQGIPPDLALRGLRAGEIYTLGCVLWELPRRHSDYAATVRGSVSALPADDFPLLLGLTELLATDDFEMQFEFGLGAILDHLAAQARRTGVSAP